jgi:LexA-binding, inner membrane-associated putative hydrolase
MSTPAGHSLVGIALARRLGVKSRIGLASAVIAASLPDADVIAGAILHGDPWRIHRRGTHTFGFAVTAGAVAGFAGLISRGTHDGDRDLIADAILGAVLVSSHVVLDELPFPYRSNVRGAAGTRIAGVRVVNWLLDAVVYGAIAWKLWPRESHRSASP